MSTTLSPKDLQLTTEFLRNSDDRAGPIRSENVSNVIFSNLFLPLAADSSDDKNSHNSPQSLNQTDSRPNTGVPWTYCNAILSAIRNPAFDPKDVTFTDCADMFRWIGCRRDEAWTIVESRSQSEPTPADEIFPQVVLECVMEFIRWRVENAMRRGRRSTWELFHPLPHKRRRFCAELVDWSDMLRNMMLVNSSWHGAARPLLGYAVTAELPTLELTQNPHFGGWTRELYLSCPTTSQNFYPSLRDLEAQFPIPFLRSICARIPHTRLASFHFEFRTLPEEFMAHLCDVISTLKALEELAFEVSLGDLGMVHKFSSLLSGTYHPSLSVLRFYISVFVKDDPFRIEDSSALLPIRSPLPKLRSIQLSCRTMSTWNIYIGGASWCRGLSDPGSPFTLDKLRINCPAESTEVLDRVPSWNSKQQEMLRSATTIEFHAHRRENIFPLDDSSSAIPSSIVGMVAPTIDLCPLAHKVVFDGFRWTRMKLFHQLYGGMNNPHKNVKELVIVVPSLPRPPRSESWHLTNSTEKKLAKLQFSMNDLQLSRALSLGLFPGLQILKLVFPNEFLDVYVEGFEYAPGYGCERLGKYGHLLLPLTRGACAARGVEFRADLE